MTPRRLAAAAALALTTALVAIAAGVVTVVVGNLPFLGLIVPNVVSMIRGDEDATLGRLRRDLARIRMALGATERPEIAVITFPAGTSALEISRAVSEKIGSTIPESTT